MYVFPMENFYLISVDYIRGDLFAVRFNLFNLICPFNYCRIPIADNKGQFAIELSEKPKLGQTGEKGEYDPYLNREVEHPTS